MDEGAFDKNFTWYEWGFVSPDDVPHDDLRVPAESNSRWHTASRLLEQWDEDNRWQT